MRSSFKGVSPLYVVGLGDKQSRGNQNRRDYLGAACLSVFECALFRDRGIPCHAYRLQVSCQYSFFGCSISGVTGHPVELLCIRARSSVGKGKKRKYRNCVSVYTPASRRERVLRSSCVMRPCSRVGVSLYSVETLPDWELFRRTFSLADYGAFHWRGGAFSACRRFSSSGVHKDSSCWCLLSLAARNTVLENHEHNRPKKLQQGRLAHGFTRKGTHAARTTTQL
ncbi:unnamed protein product [Ectocarpus sp. 6 AP-2014]